jgi:hypothetical protein
MPNEDGWGGCLGRYQAALVEAATEITLRQQNTLRRENEREIQPCSSFGRLTCGPVIGFDSISDSIFFYSTHGREGGSIRAAARPFSDLPLSDK